MALDFTTWCDLIFYLFDCRYEQVDACVATFPKPGNGPVNDPSIRARLKGLTWLATQGNSLPSAVERVLVMDATDLKDLPLTNNDDLLPGVDIEAFWRGEGRKPSRVLLRHGDNAMAIAVAKAAAQVSPVFNIIESTIMIMLMKYVLSTNRQLKLQQRQAKKLRWLSKLEMQNSQQVRFRFGPYFVILPKQTIKCSPFHLHTEAALECQNAAMASNDFIQKEIQKEQVCFG